MREGREEEERLTVMDGEPVGLLIANIHDRGVLGALGIFSKWIVTSEEE